MKKVYVAHPFLGNEQNKINVENIVRKLISEDPSVFYISPIHVIGYVYHDVSYEQGMEYCYELLKGCDELILCKGWEHSRGCKLEKNLAEFNNIPIRYL